jgi:hypothetical protein
MRHSASDSSRRPSRRSVSRFVGVLAGALVLLTVVAAGWFIVEAQAQIIVYKSPTCECCGRWVAQLREEGFDVAVRVVDDLAGIKHRLSVPGQLGSCHTSVAGAYVLEGHVPAVAITGLLSDMPDLAGIAVAGMPPGAPGMESLSPEPYDVQAFTRDGRVTRYLRMDGFGAPVASDQP